MEYKRSSHVEEEEEEEEEEDDDLDEDEEDEEEENRGHHYTTAPAAPAGAPQQQVHSEAHGIGAHSSMMEPAAFSRPLLSPNSSLVSPPPPPPGFLQPHRQPQPQQRMPERGEGAQHQLRRQQEPARNGVLGGVATPPPASTLAVAAGGAALGAAEPAQWRYKECLRNHAARLGAHVLDGCCEFMPSASEGTGALACAACGCHRSFHRREPVPGVSAAARVMSPSPTTPAVANANSSRVMPLLLAPPHMQTRPHVPASPSSAPAALAESSSEEHRGPAPAHPTRPPAPPPQRAAGSVSAPPGTGQKRFRTKFTAEQKDRMREFAHRVGWRIHKPDSDAVDAFCAQVGVSRRVLKVWMHNNKHLAKIPPQSPSSHSQQPAQAPAPYPQQLHHDHHYPPPAQHHQTQHHHHQPQHNA